MGKNRKNIKNLIAIIIIVIIIIGFWYYYKLKSNNELIKQDLGSQVTTDVEVENNESKDFGEYENKKYGYLLQYPDYLIVDDSDYSDVVFRDDFQYWQISVSANETNFEDIFVWVEDYKEMLKKEISDILEIKNVEVIIDENTALDFEIQYKENIDFYEQDIKRIFILKDNILYKISTRELDHQEIWDSFKFIEK